MASKPRLLKYLNRYITSWSLITRNIFDDIFYIFNRNWLKGNFFFYQVFICNFDNTWMVLEFLMILVSISLVKSSLFEGHSKVPNFSTVSAKFLLNVLAIWSLFTNKVFFLISFAFVVISSFSKRIILEK